MDTLIAPPDVPRSGTDMYQTQRSAILKSEPPPYPGLPRDWVDQALEAVLLYEPDKVFLFGSAFRQEDTVHSDIDLLVAIDRVPLEQWRKWEVAITVTAWDYCPYRVNPFLTDLEDLVRRRHIIISPCKWAQDEGRLIYENPALR